MYLDSKKIHIFATTLLFVTSAYLFYLVYNEVIDMRKEIKQIQSVFELKEIHDTKDEDEDDEIEYDGDVDSEDAESVPMQEQFSTLVSTEPVPVHDVVPMETPMETPMEVPMEVPVTTSPVFVSDEDTVFVSPQRESELMPDEIDAENEVILEGKRRCEKVLTSKKGESKTCKNSSYKDSNLCKKHQ